MTQKTAMSIDNVVALLSNKNWTRKQTAEGLASALSVIISNVDAIKEAEQVLDDEANEADGSD